MHDFVVIPMPLLFSTTINISQPAARPAYRLSGILPSAKGSLCGPAHRKRGRREAAALPQHILCEDGTSRQPLSGLPHCMNARASAGQQILVPSGTMSSTIITWQPQALLVPARSMPSLVTPTILAGFRLAMTIIFLPMSSLGL